ncbi:stage III sporulation protein AE [Thermobrachium celere]|uniref:Stage III sporulation protein AE n=1 Tax=Thermobrachium celere DSM 8682 TaxID=941824 RepID=R7RQ73_9CLOT|nr:stage III sporulation protein AE [Thermobrachium celere]CDF58214.1 Stage III sporulation protein AE [Thermobrachium celere DSM 8682]
MKRKILLFIFMLFILFPFNILAHSPLDNSIVDLNKIDEVSKQIQQRSEYIPDFSFSELVNEYKATHSLKGVIKSLIEGSKKYIFKEVIANSRLMIELLILGIFCALLKNMQSSFSSSSVSKIAFYACYLVIVVIIIKAFALIVELSRTTIDQMIEFVNSLMPTLMILVASVGGFATATMLDPAIMFISKLFSDVIKDFILPLTFLIVILNIVNNLSDEIKISKLVKLMEQITLWALGFLMTVFVAFITIRSSTSASIDQVTLKSTKFMVDTFIPVVGKSLSDAVSTVAGYSLLLKDAISVVGLVVMLSICLLPLIKLVILALIFKFVGAIMEPIVDGKIVDCLSSVGGSVSVLFASILSVAIMFFIIITMIASTGRLLVMVR